MAVLAALFGFLLAAANTAHGYTIVDSGFLMRKNIDPIVVPGQYKSHMHSFFGSDAVNVNTTTSEELRTGCHTNSNANDYSVYWTPTLFAVNGDERIPIEPRYFKAYYIGIEDAEIPYPENFKAVAGNASARSQDGIGAFTGVEWFCEYGPGKSEGEDAAAFPKQGCNVNRLQSLLLFQDCVNPDTLESAYSGRHNLPRVNRCPENMLRIPQLRFSVRFDTEEALPDGWSGEAPLQLASGPSYSWHGDFINGWLPEAAKNMLFAAGKREFHAVAGPLDKQPPCTSKDSDPDNGTSDYEESLLSFQIQASASAASSSSTAAASTSSISSSPSFTTVVAPAQLTTTSALDAAISSSGAATSSTATAIPSSAAAGCKQVKNARRKTRDV